MKRTLVAAIAIGLVVGAIAPGAAFAHKAKARPVATTLYFHGAYPIGEVEQFTGVVDNTFMAMDTKAPTDSRAKSKNLGWADTNCAGNRGFVVWVGQVSGTIVGNLDVTFTAAALPHDVDIRVWPDVDQLMCTSTYPEPAAKKTVSLPAGQNEIKVEVPNTSLKVDHSLMIQISPSPSLGTDSPGLGRVFYDGTDAPSHV
ncbi:MAG: hypothetical protein M3290_13080, partial [Actinomycetota bacterium]|nr:hypothetical protein [Actinomycetota bacterium]